MTKLNFEKDWKSVIFPPMKTAAEANVKQCQSTKFTDSDFDSDSDLEFRLKKFWKLWFCFEFRLVNKFCMGETFSKNSVFFLQKLLFWGEVYSNYRHAKIRVCTYDIRGFEFVVNFWFLHPIFSYVKKFLAGGSKFAQLINTRSFEQ